MIKVPTLKIKVIPSHLRKENRGTHKVKRNSFSTFLNVMVIESFDDVAERISIARIYADAWKAVNPV